MQNEGLIQALYERTYSSLEEWCWRYLHKILPDGWMLYRGAHSDGGFNIVLEVKHRGCPDWQKVFDMTGVEPEDVDPDILEQMWYSKVSHYFDKLSNEKYAHFTAKDFVVCGRSGGYWGVRAESTALENLLYFNQDQVATKLANWFLTDAGRVCLQKHDPYFIEDLANEIYDSHDESFFFECLCIKETVLQDLAKIRENIDKIAALLEDPRTWHDDVIVAALNE